MPAVWNISAPNAVQLFDFKDSITKEIIPNATITAKLVDHNKASDVVGSNFSIPVVESSIGHYGGLSPAQAFSEGTQMWLRILGTVNGATVFLEDFEVVAAYGLGR